MKGILIKTEQGWNVSYQEKLNISPEHSRPIANKIIPLHPSSVKYLASTYGSEY
jgi:hypothetical protein